MSCRSASCRSVSHCWASCHLAAFRLARHRSACHRLASPCSASCRSASPWCPKSVPISVRCTNQRLVYQSVYPDTPPAKRPSKASRTNWHTLVHPCQNNPWRRHIPIGLWSAKHDANASPFFPAASWLLVPANFFDIVWVARKVFGEN